MTELPVTSPEDDAPAPTAPPSPAPATRWAGAVASAAAVAFAAFVPLSIAGQQISWGVVLVALAVVTLTRGRGLARGALDAPLTLHVVLIGLSLLLTWVRRASPIEAFDAWRLLAIVAVGSAFVRDRAAARHALQALLGVTVLVSIYGVVQHYTGIDLLRHGAHAVRPRSNFGAGHFRSTGLFNWYSTLAMVLITALAFFAATAVELARRLWVRLALGALAVPAVLALAFTEVRAAWFGLLFGLGVALLLRGRRALVLGALGAAVAVAVVLLAFPPVREKAATTFHLTYQHNSQRIFMWAHSLEMAGDAPATGIGHGHFVAATHHFFDRWNANFPVRTHAHNSVIHWWATTGALGLAAFLWIFVAFFMAVVPAYHRARTRKDRLAAALAFGAIAAVAGIAATGVGQTPYFDGEVFYGFVFALCAGLASAAWTRDGPLPRPSVAGAVGVAVPTALGILVGFTQPGWDPSLGAAGVFTGAGSSIRVGALFALAGAAFFLAIFRSLRRKVLTDGFAWSLALAAVLATLAWVGVVKVLAPAAHVPNDAGPWVLAGALAMLTVAFAFRVLLLSPLGWPGIAGVALVSVAAGAMTHGIEAPDFQMLPMAKSGPVVVGHDDRVPVASLPAHDPWRRLAAAVVHYGPIYGGRGCQATVIGGRALLTTDRCASLLLGEVEVGHTRVRCLRAVDRVPGDDLADVRCRPVSRTEDLVDLAGASLALDRHPPAVGDPLLRVTRTRVARCRVTGLHGAILTDDCDGAGPPGAPLVSPTSGAVVAVDLGRTVDGKANRAAVAARLLRGRDGDHDGIPDGVDDCLRAFNPSQIDSDRNGIGDACERMRGAAFSGGTLFTFDFNGRVQPFAVHPSRTGETALTPAGPPIRTRRAWLGGIASGSLGGGPALVLASSSEGTVTVLDPTGRRLAELPGAPHARFGGVAVGHFQGAGAPETIAVAQNRDHRIRILALVAGHLTEVASAPLAQGGRIVSVAAAPAPGGGADHLLVLQAGHPAQVTVLALHGRDLERVRTVPAPRAWGIVGLVPVRRGGRRVVYALVRNGALRPALPGDAGAGLAPGRPGGALWAVDLGGGKVLVYRERDPGVVVRTLPAPP